MTDEIPDYVWLRRLIAESQTEEAALVRLHERDEKIRADERERCIKALRESKTGISTRELAIKSIEANQKKGD